MAPMEASSYLPPLDGCLDGGKQILSWKLVCESLEESNGVGHNTALKKFFQDARTFEALAHSLEARPRPRQDARSDFDTYTSAINISPNGNGSYDVKQIKEDALWLSEVLKVDEVTALRVTVLEWQSRSESKLRECVSNDTSLGLSTVLRLRSSLLRNNGQTPLSRDQDGEKFNSQPSQRLRLLKTWCEERQFQFKCLEQVVIKTMENMRVNANSREEQDDPSWLVIGPKLIKSWDNVGDRSVKQQLWLSQTVDYLGYTAQQLSGNDGILQDNPDFDEFQLHWYETKGVELTYALHVISTILQSSKSLATPDDFGAWFHLMSEINFFEGFEIPLVAPDSVLPYFLSSLSALATLALLDIPIALETIVEVSSIPAAGEDVAEETYLHSGRVMEEASQVILNALRYGCRVSQPVALAWSIILQEARERTQHAQESRDHRLEQRAYDSLGQSQLSDSESNESFPQKGRPFANRRTSFGSDTSQQQSLLDYNIDCIQKIESQDDVINFIARSSLHGVGAYGEMANLAVDFCTTFCANRKDGAEPRLRFLLLQVVEASLNHVQYGDSIVSSTLALLTGSRGGTEMQPRGGLDVGAGFLQSRAFMEHIFEEASNRFPFESVPFLELCSALADAHLPDSSDPFVIEYLKELQTYTTVVSEQDTRYDLLEDDPYYIELQTPLDVSAVYGSLGRGHQLALPSNVPIRTSASNLVLTTLPQGTRGATLTDTKPMVVRFDFKQPGFAFLGRMVQQAALTYASSEKWSLEVVLEPAIKIIELLTRLLRYTSAETRNGSKGQLSSLGILEAFSDGLDRNADIVSVIFDIFEGELYEQHSLTGGPPTELLAHCVQFIQALLIIQPARVWPFLSRSSLLGIDGAESRFLGVVASQEMPLGRYPFLVNSLRLFEALIDDVVTRSVSKFSISTAITRFESPDPPSGSAGIRDAQVTKIVHVCTKHIVDIFESSGNWKSAAANEEKMVIQELLCRTMEKLLSYCFDADDATELPQKLPGVLSSSAIYLLEVFLSRSKSEIPTDPFVQNICEGLQIPTSPLLARITKLSTTHLIATTSLATKIVRVNAYLGLPSCRLEEQLFECAEMLARNFAVHNRFRLTIVELLLSMMTGSNRLLEQPASLLGHLGQQAATLFLDMLSKLDGALPNPDYAVKVWKFLSAVVSQRQQWSAIYLLTGKTARTTLREEGKDCNGHIRSQSLLDIATSKLCRIGLLPPPETTAMLEFVALAADFWLWVPERLEQNSGFIKELTRVLTELNNKSYSRQGRPEDMQAFDTQVAASIANIFAMIVHRGNEKKDASFAKLISRDLTFFVRAGVSTTSYNLSLHRSLQKNFEAKYPKCRLFNFKRTTVRTTPFGRDFFYDLGLANKVLSFDKAWAREDGKGFLDEFERANLNLSLVQAQINLFHAWKSLAIELALALGTHEAIQGYMAKVISACLKTNREAILPEGVFGTLAQSRADLAFVLLQRLIDVSRTSNNARSILIPAWNTLRGHAPDLGQALTSSDANYDRTLIRIVYLALQAYLPEPQDAENVPVAVKDPVTGPDFYTLILEILGTCVAKGFRSIVSLLHEDPSKVVPTDLALLNAILRTCLRVPNIERQTEQLVSHFADSQTARYASTLFSWADQLLVDGDPVYGELSIEFLVELSSVPALAESMVLGGILSQISASNLSKFFARPGGTGPFDQPARIYVIWSRGILPLVINLLRAIEAPIAGDVAAFLDQFKPQLDRASQCLDPKPSRSRAGTHEGYVTLNEASEVHSLAIIFSIFELFREAGPSVGIAPNEIPHLALEVGVLRSDLETRLQRRNALREDIVPIDEREEGWAREKPADSDNRSENLLEHKVVEELKSASAVLGEQD